MQDGEVTLRRGPGDTQGRVAGRLRGGDRGRGDYRGDWLERREEEWNVPYVDDYGVGNGT